MSSPTDPTVEEEAAAAYDGFRAARIDLENIASPKWEFLREDLKGLWREAVRGHCRFNTSSQRSKSS